MRQRIIRFLEGGALYEVAVAAHHLLVEIAVLTRDVPARLRLRLKHRCSKGLRIHFGCGFAPKSGWLNLDLSPAADFRIDLRRKLPLPDACADRIFAEHFLEHLHYPGKTMAFLHDCNRLLASSGELLLSVPDTESAVSSYRRPQETSYYYSEMVQAWHAEWCHTPMEHINYHFRQNAEGRPPYHHEYHHFAFDFETLEKVLHRAGFVHIAERPFDPQLDSEHRRLGSLRVIARK